MKLFDFVKVCTKTNETRCNIPVAKIKSFYEFLLTKDIEEIYRLKQCQKKFKLPMYSILWALNQE